MANSDYTKKGSGPFCPIAYLAVAVSYLDEAFSIAGLNEPKPNSLKVGMGAMIGEEIVRIVAIGPGVIKVARGCADTVPAEHGAREVIWFYDGYLGTNAIEYAGGEVTSSKIMPFTAGGGQYPIEDAPPNTVQMNWRFWRPYAPGQMRTNGTPWFQPKRIDADNGYLALSWAHRHRVLQQDQLVEHNVGDIGPEPGVTYMARIYNQSNELLRTEVGLNSNTWNYTWSQAIYDFGLQTMLEGNYVEGHIEFYAVRDGFESWQGYVIPFTISNQGAFMRAASLGVMSAQAPDDGVEASLPTAGVYAASLGIMSAQLPDDNVEATQPVDGIYAMALHESVAQLTSFNTPLERNLFEAPFLFVRRRGLVDEANHVVTMVARPSDRLTDGHTIYTGDKTTTYQPIYGLRDTPKFTPWAVTTAAAMPLDTVIKIGNTSFYDGVALTDVRPGQLAMIGAELLRVVRVSEGEVEVARGCGDTVPTTHASNTRLWFFEAGCGFDRTEWPDTATVIAMKAVPDVYGPALDLTDIPMDTLNMFRRVERPYPPGRMLVDGHPWFEGGTSEPGRAMVFTWHERNRIAQGDAVIDHMAPQIEPEAGTQYRINLTVYQRVTQPDGSTSLRPIVIRNDFVTGTAWEYTEEMANSDGLRAAAIIGSNRGKVYVPLWIYTHRDGLDSWQGYQTMVALNVPYGTGGGGGGQTGGDGGGQTGGGGNGNAGEDNEAVPDPEGGGKPPDNGGGTPPPIKPPPTWPPIDPIDPPAPDPGPTDPQFAGHWDLNWDKHWDARRPGDDEGVS
jgi:hypothetical protein